MLTSEQESKKQQKHSSHSDEIHCHTIAVKKRMSASLKNVIGENGFDDTVAHYCLLNIVWRNGVCCTLTQDGRVPCAAPAISSVAGNARVTEITNDKLLLFGQALAKTFLTKVKRICCFKENNGWCWLLTIKVSSEYQSF